MRRHGRPPLARRHIPPQMFVFDDRAYHLSGVTQMQGQSMAQEYQNPGPTREEIDATRGPVLLQFGTCWCGYCQAAAPHIAEALAQYPAVQHIKVEDGKGRP